MAVLGYSYFKYVIRGIITLISGLLLLLLPGLTMQTAMVVVGAMLMSSGLVTLFLTNRKLGTIRGFYSLQGLFSIIIGLLFIIAPTALLKIFIVFFGIILIMIGSVQMIGAIGSFSWRGWSIGYLIFSILMLAGGMLLLFNPFKSLEAIVSLLGVLLVFYGISQIISGKAKPRGEFYKGSQIEDIPHEEVK